MAFVHPGPDRDFPSEFASSARAPIGSYFAVRLALAGNDVSYVMRGPFGDGFRGQGGGLGK